MRIRVSELFEEPLPATDAIDLKNDTAIDSEKIRQLVWSKIGETAAAACEESGRRSVGYPSYRPRRPKRMAVGIALIALTVVLLCGFTYAVTTGVLSVKDDAGREIMRVKSPDAIPAEQMELEDRIKKTVEGQLQRGEAAFMLMGQEAIDAIRRHEEPKTWITVNRGYEYSSVQAISPYLTGALRSLNQLGDQVMDAKIAKVEVQHGHDLGTPNAVQLQPDKWVVTTDSASGYPYAYYKLRTDEHAEISGSDFVKLTYRTEDSTFTLMATQIDYGWVEINDQNPSAKRIHEVEGVPIYHSKGQDKPFLFWVQTVHGKQYEYTLESDADLKQQLDFAKTVITTASVER